MNIHLFHPEHFTNEQDFSQTEFVQREPQFNSTENDDLFDFWDHSHLVIKALEYELQATQLLSSVG
jgi:hypothetical protein